MTLFLRFRYNKHMRIIEPKRFQQEVPKKGRSKRSFIVFVLFVVSMAAGGYILFIRDSQTSVKVDRQDVIEVSDQTEQQITLPQDDIPPSGLRVFSDNEFKVFYDNLLQPNLERVENPPIISGNDVADARIRKLAEDRGYRLRSSPNVKLVSVEGSLLHESVVDDWTQLKASAANAGLQISIVSGYRSVESQRQLFLQRLNATGATIESVAAGVSDNEVNKVLTTSSIPGYSKHHTGYTIDLLCAGYIFENFKNSPCQSWISADNYKVAKENGFIPSYPPLADAQGPDPEAWEYVWVGKDALYQ